MEIKNKKQFGLILVILIRVLSSFLVFWKPIEAIFLSFFLDIIDGTILAYYGWKREEYHRIDKPLDFFHYVLLLIVAMNTSVFFIALLLFIFRMIGHVLFEFSKDDRVFILFPNIFEYYLLLHLIFVKYIPDLSVNRWWILLLLIIFKLCIEIFRHYFKFDWNMTIVDWYKKKRAESKHWL